MKSNTATVIVSIVFTAGVTAAAYLYAKRSGKKLKTHKEEKLRGRDLDLEIRNASFDNFYLTETGYREKTARVLMEMKARVDSSMTIEQFDQNIANLDDILNCCKDFVSQGVSSQDALESFTARINYWSERFKEEDDQRDINAQRQNEIDKYRAFGSSITKVAKEALNSLTPPAPVRFVNYNGGTFK